MFYNKFCSIVSCSVISAIIEEPTCTDSSESIQLFKHFNWLSSQSSLYKADEIKILDSLVVSCGFWFQETSLLHFSVSFLFYQWISLNVGTRIFYTACSRWGWTMDLYNGRISSLFMCMKLWAMNPSTLLAVLQLFSVCFC